MLVVNPSVPLFIFSLGFRVSCTECDAVFTTQSRLNIHVRMKHEGALSRCRVWSAFWDCVSYLLGLIVKLSVLAHRGRLKIGLGLVNKVLMLCGIEGVFFFAVPSLLTGPVSRAPWRACKTQCTCASWVTKNRTTYG